MRTQVTRAAAPRAGGRAPSRRLRALDLATGMVLLLAVAVASVLPETPGLAGRADWVGDVERLFWVVLVLWACREGLLRESSRRPGLRLVVLAGTGLAWQVVLARGAGATWPGTVGAVEPVAVAAVVLAGAVLGARLRQVRPGRSMPAYVVGRVVAHPAVAPLRVAGRMSIPVYFASHLMLLGLLTRGEPALAYRLGEWAEPFALGHNRAAVVLIVVGFWTGVVLVLHRGARNPAR